MIIGPKISADTDYYHKDKDRNNPAAHAIFVIRPVPRSIDYRCHGVLVIAVKWIQMP